MNLFSSLYNLCGIVLTGFMVTSSYASPLFIEGSNVCPEDYHICTSIEAPQIIEKSIDTNITGLYTTNIFSNEFDICTDVTYNITHTTESIIFNSSTVKTREKMCYIQNSIVVVNETKIINDCIQCSCLEDSYGFSYPKCDIDKNCGFLNTTKTSFTDCLGQTQHVNVGGTLDTPNNVVCCPDHQCRDAYCAVCSKTERDILKGNTSMPSKCHLCKNGSYLLSGYSNKCLRETQLSSVCENGIYSIDNVTNTADCYSQPLQNKEYLMFLAVPIIPGIDEETYDTLIYGISVGILVTICTFFCCLQKYTKRYLKSKDTNEQTDNKNQPENSDFMMTRANPMVYNQKLQRV